MSEQKIGDAVARLREFSRQARLSRDTDPAALYTVWTDPQAERVALSLDDLDLVVSELGKAQGLRAPWSM